LVLGGGVKETSVENIIIYYSTHKFN
jgi:hypothetical protein